MSGSFFSELKRRNVLRVAMAYAAAAWLLVQNAAMRDALVDYGSAQRW